MESLLDERFVTAVEDGSRFQPNGATRVITPQRFVTEVAARTHASMNGLMTFIPSTYNLSDYRPKVARLTLRGPNK
jgi:hypothetical protein